MILSVASIFNLILSLRRDPDWKMFMIIIHDDIETYDKIYLLCNYIYVYLLCNYILTLRAHTSGQKRRAYMRSNWPQAIFNLLYLGKYVFLFFNLEETFFAAKSMKLWQYICFFKINNLSWICNNCENDLFWKKIHKICNFEIFIVNLQFWDISSQTKIILTPSALPGLNP